MEGEMREEEMRVGETREEEMREGEMRGEEDEENREIEMEEERMILNRIVIHYPREIKV